MPYLGDASRRRTSASRRHTRQSASRILRHAACLDTRSSARLSRPLRPLYHLGPEFTGLDAGAFWEDAKVGLRHMTGFEKCAVVTNVSWIREAVGLFRVLIPCPVHIFRNDQLTEAKTVTVRPEAS